jgi:3' terminal RNA ribose 2'-O-methyltransferase Hen1
MLLTLTLTSTTAPATDLGYLLHKSPFRVQAFDLTFGKAHVFYPEAEPDRCTAALLLEVDPIGLVRGRRGPPGGGRSLEQYVNDRPYVASSFLSVAIAEVFGTALSGRCKERPELASRALPLEARLSVLPCRGGEAFLRRLFEPLGYQVSAHQHVLDATNPDWGLSRYFTVAIAGSVRLCDLLTHLYVLVPVLDDDKHYWVGDDEVEKLVRRGEGWLAEHPARDVIVRRYLKHQRSLTRQALDQLIAEELPIAEDAQAVQAQEEAEVEQRIRLNEERIGAVVAALRESGAKRILDLGCGEGQLVRALLKERFVEEVVGLDVSHRALELARDRLRLERMPEKQRARLQLLHGSLLYRDQRLAGYDAAALVEVIEHLDPPRLAAFERTVFEHAAPGTVVVTTPNGEYNVRFENLPAGRFRHKDHRFEWSRAEFEAWARAVADRFQYRVRFVGVGPEDAVVGSPTQMAVFER